MYTIVFVFFFSYSSVLFTNMLIEHITKPPIFRKAPVTTAICCTCFFAWFLRTQRDPKVSKNDSQNCPLGSFGRDFVIFLISMPLSARIAVFMVPGRQKSIKISLEIAKKTAPRKKNTPTLHIFLKKNKKQNKLFFV